MQLFRSQALEHVSSPDQLRQPQQLIRPHSWLLLLAILGFGGYILLWAVQGRLPVRIEGRGLLVRPGSLQPVQSRSTGPITSIAVQPGRCVTKGQALARIDPLPQRLKREEELQALSLLLAQDGQEAQRERHLQAMARDDLSRLMPYRSSGAIAAQTFFDKAKEIERLRGEGTASANRRQQAIRARQTAIASLDREMAQSAVVLAPASGCIVNVNVQPGQMVQSGTTLLELDKSRPTDPLVSLAFFPVQDGKRLRVGQRVRVTPSTTQAQRHGGIVGTIVDIQPLPVNRESLLNRLGIASLVNTVEIPSRGEGAPGGAPMIQVRTSLARNPATSSGYDWGGGTGPDLVLSAGTTTTVKVDVEGRQPISYLIPRLRDLSGIY